MRVRVTVVGTGHVGLLTEATLAALEHDVVEFDDDQEKIGLLRQGISPFYEPGLPKLIQEGASSGRLRFEVRAYDAVAESEVVFICVGTPARVSGEVPCRVRLRIFLTSDLQRRPETGTSWYPGLAIGGALTLGTRPDILLALTVAEC